MSRTYRQVPQNHTGFRRPHTQQERRQLRGLKADKAMWGVNISPINRSNRSIIEEWDDVIASSIYELDYAN